MIKYTKCPSCDKEQLVKAEASTRGDLQMKLGNEVRTNCNNCGKNYSSHINDITAKIDNRIIVGGAILSVIVTGFLWYYFGAIGTISIIIPGLFWKQQESGVRSFNRYKIKR